MLDLEPGKYSFGLIDTGSSSKETLQAALQQRTPVRGDGTLNEIVLNNQSVMEVLRLASVYVDVPAGDLSAGIARNRVAPDAKWLQIRNSAAEPERAWLKIKRRGIWYYIADDDVNSRLQLYAAERAVLVGRGRGTGVEAAADTAGQVRPSPRLRAGHGLVRPSHGWCDRDRP